jgi:hypothetical protein
MPRFDSAKTLGFPIHAAWPRTRHLARKVRVVVDELVNRFLPVPPWGEPAHARAPSAAGDASPP